MHWKFGLQGTGNYSTVAFDGARHAETFETRTAQAHLDSIKREFELLWDEGRIWVLLICNLVRTSLQLAVDAYLSLGVGGKTRECDSMFFDDNGGLFEQSLRLVISTGTYLVPNWGALIMTQDRPVKKRKATYLKRKEEQNALQDQIRALQQQLQELQANNGGGVSQLAQLTASVGLNVALKQSVEQQQLGVATAQSLVSRRLQDESGSPVNVYIHLGREWVERRATLVDMKGERLDQGFRYVTARCQHLHALKPHFSEERFEDANGDFCCLRNEVIPFPGIQSVRKVFDAVKFTMNTLEISISEQLGHITVHTTT
uniref:Uncharacterized protein n=1 Tax=Phytophthora ramorum TaxID=164328 RepID=H3GW15_PHYRM